MRICATVAEYNPLHLGHIKHIEYMKNELKADRIIVLMSGNYTQRGEPAVLNKFKRAKQAVIAGADAVIELPTVFATANAEVFSKGAINLLNSLNIAEGLCFGVESGEKQDYISLANALNDESKEFKKVLKERLDSGVSFAKAKYETVKTLKGDGFNESLISSPNNILGVEYTRAIKALNSDIDIFPFIRCGDHNSIKLKKGITSASSIRNVIKSEKLKKLKKSVPAFVYDDLKEYPYDFNKITMAKLILSSREELSEILDCTEGLENRIKALLKDNRTVDGLVEKVSTKRYTMARIRRIIIANLLGIKSDFVFECLSNPLYAKILAVNSNSKDLISELNEKSSIPVISRKSDALSLKKTALKCWELDCLANDIYNLAVNEKENENQMLII